MLPTASKQTSTKLPSAVVLMVLTVLSVGVGYTTSILVARWIGPEAFKDYAVTIASISLLSTLAEAGVGKFALKYIPECQSQKAWPLLAGFLRFAILLVISTSFFLATIVVFGETIDDNKFGSYPLGIGILFLPFLAFAGTGVDFVMANRAPIVGAFIARIVIPCVTLTLLISLQQYVKLSVVWAVACYGGGSALGAMACFVAFVRTAPKEVFSSTPAYHIKDWLRECAYFLLVAFMLTWTFRIGLIVIKLLTIPEKEVGLFAAALETGCLVLLLSKSTDKLFQPEMSLILERHDWTFGEQLRKRRHLLIGSGCVIFLAIVFFLGKQILSLYGPEFVAGYPALCFISIGTCLWTMFSLAPLYLRYVGRDDIVIRITLVSALSMALLTAVLGDRYGCTGGGVAFSLVMSLTAIAFFLCANFDFVTKKDRDDSNSG